MSSHESNHGTFRSLRSARSDSLRAYKLLATFALKRPDGRYEVNDEVMAKMRAYLEGRQQRQMAMALLRKRGFKGAAARKWLQRHSIDDIRTARPRSPRRPQ